MSEMQDPIKLGLDYSARRLSGASIKEAGYSFVFRYLDFPGQRWPALNREEYEDLTRNGIEVHAIFEINIHDAGGGREGGKRNASTAVQSARAAGLPLGSTIFMCADAVRSSWNYTMDTAMAYLDAARLVIEDSGYVIGAYGFKEFIYAAQDGAHADVFWLCGSESGVREGIHAYQWNNGRVYVDGLDCDLNKMYIEIGENDMTPEQDAILRDIHAALAAAHANSGKNIGELVADGHAALASAFTEDDVAGSEVDAKQASNIGDKVKEIRAATQEILARLSKIEVGGVSEERIAEIAVDAVDEKLGDK